MLRCSDIDPLGLSKRKARSTRLPAMIKEDILQVIQTSVLRNSHNLYLYKITC
jgi:hypothetical protein